MNERTKYEIRQERGRLLLNVKSRPLRQIDLTAYARDGGYRVEEVCQRVGVSIRYLQLLFQEAVGLGPKEWMRRQRMVDARHMLKQAVPLKDVAFQLGFSSYGAFHRDFQEFYGCTPSFFVEKHCPKA